VSEAGARSRNPERPRVPMGHWPTQGNEKQTCVILSGGVAFFATPESKDPYPA